MKSSKLQIKDIVLDVKQHQYFISITFFEKENPFTHQRISFNKTNQIQMLKINLNDTINFPK